MPLVLPFQPASGLKDAPPTEWAVKPWIAYGAITEIAGRAKAAGKSTLIQGMIKAYLDGAEFLGVPLGTPGPVAYLTEEDSTTLREALSLAGLLRPNLFLLQWRDVLSKPWPDLMRAVKKDIAEIGARLVIVDTLPQFAPNSETDAESGIEAIKPLRLLTGGGCAVVIIRHERKAGGGVGQASRGTTALGAGVDIMLHLRRTSKGRVSSKATNVRTLEALSRFRDTPERLEIALTEKGYERVQANDLAAHKALVLNSMNGVAVSAQWVIDTTKLARASAQRALMSLVEDGALKREGGGKKGSPALYKKVISTKELKKSVRENIS